MEQPDELAARLEELEGELQRCREEVGMLRLALDTLSTIDPVTGAANRVGILQAIRDAEAWNRREAVPFAVMMLRIPALEEAANTRPTPVVDELCVHTAAVIGAALRGVDQVGRVSPGRFVLVLRRLDATGAVTVAKRLTGLLGSVPVEVRGETYELWPRVAVALVAPGAPASPEGVLGVLERAEGSPNPDAPEVVAWPRP